MIPKKSNERLADHCPSAAAEIKQAPPPPPPEAPEDPVFGWAISAEYPLSCTMMNNEDVILNS
jgi:hypothetical protein